MATMTQISIWMDSDVAEAAIEVLDEIGMSMTTAINVYLKRIVRDRRIPFDLRAESIPYAAMAEQAYKPTLDQNGIAILPTDWADDDER